MIAKLHMWLLQLDLKYYGGKGVAKGGRKRNQRKGKDKKRKNN